VRDLLHHLLGERIDDVAKNLLVLRQPGCISRIWLHDLVGALDLLGQGSFGSIDQPSKLGAADGRQYLQLP